MINLITFQDAFRKIQTVESIYLNDTVQHFRNHAMELSKSELKELTDVLENDVCREIERITNDFSTRLTVIVSWLRWLIKCPRATVVPFRFTTF